MSSSPVEETTTNSTPVSPPQDPVNVYDFGSVKAKIDKSIRDILMIERSYKEDLTTSNIRIVLGMVACASAITAYFKTNPTIVLSLCAAYVLSSIMCYEFSPVGERIECCIVFFEYLRIIEESRLINFDTFIFLSCTTTALLLLVMLLISLYNYS